MILYLDWVKQEKIIKENIHSMAIIVNKQTSFNKKSYKIFQELLKNLYFAYYARLYRNFNFVQYCTEHTLKIILALHS